MDKRLYNLTHCVNSTVAMKRSVVFRFSFKFYFILFSGKDCKGKSQIQKHGEMYRLEIHDV